MTDPLLLEIPEEIFSERLTLRMPRAGHQQQVFESILSSKPELERWLSFAQNPPTLEECEAHLRRNHARFLLREALNFELFLRSSEIFVGRVSFVRLDWTLRKFEIGYWLDWRYTGRGLMLEAVQTLTQMVFDTLEARRVEILCDVRNTGSRKVAENAGFTLEGILKNNALDVQDETLWVDDCLYARVQL
jgi:ribosomal-protein-serine acetyltransferase